MLSRFYFLLLFFNVFWGGLTSCPPFNNLKADVDIASSVFFVLGT